MTDDLIAFLTARLNEDEGIARAVEDGSAPWDGQWTADGANALRTRNGHTLAYGHMSTDGRALPMPLKPGLTEHWARHDPARVLAEVDAKRRILTEFTQAGSMPDTPERRARSHWAGDFGYLQGLARAVHLLALPYANHPDYDEAWRP